MTAPALQRPFDGAEAEPRSIQVLRWAAVVYVATILVHGADHLRRGLDATTIQVLAAGQVQFTLAVLVLMLVRRGHRRAAAGAAALGFASALLFVAVHFAPHWGVLSDSFTGSRVGPGVTGLSWAAAVVEVAAGLALGWAGLRAHGASDS